MSIQPSPIYNNKLNHNNWHELLKLAEILSTQFRLESLLSYLTDILKQNYISRASLWLVSSYSIIIVNEGLQNHASILKNLSPLMEQAFREKRILPRLAMDPLEVYNPSIVAVPLIVKDENLGVIQLEKLNQDGFSLPDIDFISSITSQFSHALRFLLKKSHNDYLQQNITQLTLIEELSKSILSNLDKDSLLNSILSILRQTFGFWRVNIYMVKGDEKKTYKHIGISTDGIEPETNYDFEHDSGPVHRSFSDMEPVIVNNKSLSLRFSAAGFSGNIRSELVIPLQFGELVIGALDLCSDAMDEFGPDKIKGFQILAQNIAVAIRNANLFRSEEISGLINDRLQKTVGKISTEETLDDILQSLFDELEEILPWDAAAIWMIDNTINITGTAQFSISISLAAIRIAVQNSLETNQVHPLVTDELLDKYSQNSEDANDLLSLYPWISEIINSETPVIRNSTSTYEPLGVLLGFNSDYSAIGAPLLVNNQCSGIIVLVHHKPDQFNVESKSIANLFANFMAIRIENTKIYTSAHNQAWISTVLLQVAEATQLITNVDELLETVVSMLPGLIGIDACAIFLWDQSNDTYFPQAFHGFDVAQLDRFYSWDIFPGSVHAYDQLKDSHHPVILSADNLSDDIALQIFPDYDFHNDLMVLFPLDTQNSFLGAFLIDFSNSTLGIGSSQEIWDEKYTIIQGAARQTAISIENLKLIKAEEEEAYISVALLQVAQAIVSLNALDEILGAIVRITPILVGVKRCIIYLWDSKNLVFRQSQYYGISKNDLNMLGQVIKVNEFPFIEAIRQNDQIIFHSMSPASSPLDWNDIAPGEYQVIEGIISDNEENNNIKLDSKLLKNRERLLIGFPISIKAEMLGVMLIEEEEHIKGSTSLHIREKRIEILRGITQQAAMAIKNELLQQDAVKSERIERELQLAREIQTTFLPEKLPELPGWDISVKWQPARQVGGDFYDIIILDDERIGFVIADVADKGMPAALFMTLIRTLIRAAAKEKLSPAAVLKQVNELLVPDSKHGMFVTVFYGEFSLNSGKVVYANAGHNPPIVKKFKQNELIELSRTTMALGIFDNIEVEERELSLNPGDWMLLYTDGITEAFSAEEEMFGAERLFKLLSDYMFISTNELIDTINGRVEDFIRGTDLSDDMTLAVISRKIQ
jgi:sigma-B regulation protein RsbU (phosphoserine phosphatase)